MKNVILSIGIVFLVVNGLLGLLLSGYGNFNLVFTSIVIVVTTLLLYLLCAVRIKDGYVVGLSFFYAVLGLVEYVLGLVSPQVVHDNASIVISTILFSTEIVAFIICYNTSKNK